MNKFFSSAYWFQVDYTGFFRFDKTVFIGSLVLLALGVAAAVYKKGIKNRLLKEYLSGWVAMFITIGIFGLIWYGLRYELIPIFATRFWALLIFVWGLIWTILLIINYFRKYKPAVENFHKELERQKYM